MFITFNWRIIQWLIVIAIGVIPLFLKLAGMLEWLPWWYFIVPVVVAAPQLVVIAIVALVGWIALRHARVNSDSTSSKWSDK